MFNKGCGTYTLDVMQVQFFFSHPLTLQIRLLFALCSNFGVLTVLMLVASLPCAPCTHFGSYISIFLSFVAVDERCVCSVYPIWGHQSYMYREGSAFYKILAVIFGFQSTTVNAEFFLMLQQQPLCSNVGVCMIFFHSLEACGKPSVCTVYPLWVVIYQFSQC